MPLDWSLAPTVALNIPRPFTVAVAMAIVDARFSIAVSAAGFTPDFVATVAGGGVISTALPASGVPFTYTPPDVATGPPVVTVSHA